MSALPHHAMDADDAFRVRFPRPFNMAEVFIDRHRAEGRGARIAIHGRNGDVTYEQLARAVNGFGQALRAEGLVSGERVLMLLPDGPEFFFVFWGAIKAGLVPVPLNTLLRAADLAYIIGHSECAAIVHGTAMADELDAARAQAAHRPRRVMTIADLADQAARSPDDASPAPTNAEDDAFWLYSSGTTGKPKGVVHSHASMPVICQLFGHNILGITEDDVVLSVPRLFFSYGMGIAMVIPLWFGAAAVLDDRRPTAETVTELLRRFAPTVFAAVPTFYAMLLATGELGPGDFGRLRHCLSGGEAMPAEIMNRWRELTGVRALEMIGSTEAGFVYISNRPDDLRVGTTGKPVPGYRVRIVDGEGNDVPSGTPGRLLLRGQSLFSRYWNDPERTARAMAGGWFDTGDMYRQDDSGYYIYCGRSDDMLKVGGRWISPFEIESAIVQHPAVREAAAVGRADADGLVRIEAWVVPNPDARADETLAEAIRAFCKQRLAPYKFPRWVRFVDDLPKTATGKIQRFKLREPSIL